MAVARVAGFDLNGAPPPDGETVEGGLVDNTTGGHYAIKVSRKLWMQLPSEGEDYMCRDAYRDGSGSRNDRGDDKQDEVALELHGD